MVWMQIRVVVDKTCIVPIVGICGPETPDPVLQKFVGNEFTPNKGPSKLTILLLVTLKDATMAPVKSSPIHCLQ